MRTPFKLVSVYFGGKGPYSFVLTENRPYSTISQKLLNHLGLPIEHSDILFNISHQGKNYDTSYIKIRDVELLNQFIPETSMIMVDLNTNSVFGYIGQDILDHFNVCHDDGEIILSSKTNESEFYR